MEPVEAQSLYTRSTQLSADSAEGHPFLPRVFALGTYQVDQHACEAAGETRALPEEAHRENLDDFDPTASTSPEYTRRGTLTLLRAGAAPGRTADCEVLDVHSTPAILDMKWTAFAHEHGRAGLTLADATGHARLYDVTGLRFEPRAKWRMNPRGALCLSLDWAEDKLIVSQSDGTLAYLPNAQAALDESLPLPVVAQQKEGQSVDEKEDVDEDEDEDEDEVAAHRTLNDPSRWTCVELDHMAGQSMSSGPQPRGLETWRAHDNEAWIAAWDKWSAGQVLWSGADDLTLKGWDVRESNGGTGRRPSFVTTRGFDGGVTCLASHSARQHLWAVGSYDGKVRLFDARMPQRPLRVRGDLAALDVEGGVWRLKWHPQDPARLLVGAMHGGFKIIRCAADGDADDQPPLQIVKRFDGHKSIAYGCDWDRGTSAAGLAQPEDETLVCSVSFYDATMHLWRG